MPITFAKPPAGMAAALAEALPRIGNSAAVEMRAPAISRAASGFAMGDDMRVAMQMDDVEGADAIATPVYVAGLDDIINGRLVAGARLALWAQIVPTEAGAVSAEVTATTTKFAQISNGIANGRFRNAVTRMAAPAGEGSTADGEIAQLRVPALHMTFLWLKAKKGDDLFEPVETSMAAVKVGQRYTEKQLVEALRGPAQVAASNQGDG
jgi:hypothetical protein